MVQIPLGSSHILHATRDNHVNKKEKGMILDLVRWVKTDFTSGSYDCEDGGMAESVRVESDEKRVFGLPSCMTSRRVYGDASGLMLRF